MPLPANFEKSLWAAADQLCTNSALQPSEYSTPVLALIFLKLADTRCAQAEKQLASKTGRRGGVTKDDYHALGVPYVPETARFQRLLVLPEGTDIGKALNEAMKAIEEENDELKDVLRRYMGASMRRRSIASGSGVRDPGPPGQPLISSLYSLVMKRHAFALLLLVLTACRTTSPEYDVVIRNAMIYDGSGSAPRRGDVAIKGQTIAALADELHGTTEIDAHGLAVAPGFINMLSWAVDSLIVDGRSQSDIRQGVTLEVFGEGESMGPLTPEMKAYGLRRQGDIKYPIEWTTLAEYLDWLTRRGISTNVASFIGATTVRIHEIGYADRPPTAEELARMKELVRQAIREGALGVGSSLIYAPAVHAKTPELIELCRAAGEHGGSYISHIRSEGNQLEEGVDELITIAREANVPAEIYHLKAAGQQNWPKMDTIVRRVEDARRRGLKITADMYTYTAGATGLDAMMPPWVQEGVFEDWRKRLQEPSLRARLGPFDLVMLEVGAFHPSWGTIHLGPENALEALALLGGGSFLPVHWGTFNLAIHAWDEPAETLVALAPKRDVRLVMPRLGAPVEPTQVERVNPWWREVAALETKERAGDATPEAEGAAVVVGEPID